jgi:hypothetical protein
MRALSPDQLHDVGIDPSEISPTLGFRVDAATMSNLMSMR